ncbi:MAG: peptidoglycan editing factor PgeF [Candidatus Saccharicenans sp.]|uniref:peptidoglycan editing factor PgeF n=1 Tax=Candidatus Saccharicenans sp. TaxID=2819258 RepID=UPI00404B48CB
MSELRKYISVPGLESFSWLVHGFGLAGFTLESLPENRELASFQAVVMKQLHSNHVHYLEEPPRKKLAGDGLVTSSPGLLLVIKTADCLPVLLLDEDNRAVAAVHCGWRSTYQKILVRAVDLMRRQCGSRPEKLLAVFGPCIEKSCYEVGPEVQDQFAAAGFETEPIFSSSATKDRFFLDLREANRLLLTRELGLNPENIIQIDHCTFCRPQLYSYRRDRQDDQRLINFIGIKNRS